MLNKSVAVRLIAVALMSIASASCSVFDVGRGVYDVADSTRHTLEVVHETDLFRRHWDILKESALPNPALLSDADVKSLEKDLQPLADKLAQQFAPLVASNPDIAAQLFRHRLPRPHVRVVKSRDFYAYAEQGDREQFIVVSSALIWRNMNQFADMIFQEKARYRQEHGLRADEETVEMTGQIAIPHALEYKDSLIFVLAHESTHLLVDPPLKPKDITKEIEARADAVGLLLTARTSFIADIKERILGIQNLYLIVNGNGADRAYAPVAYARFGAELLFEINKEAFEPGAAGIYNSVEERTTAAKSYMNKMVWNNIHTDFGTWVSYVLNSVKG